MFDTIFQLSLLVFLASSSHSSMEKMEYTHFKSLSECEVFWNGLSEQYDAAAIKLEGLATLTVIHTCTEIHR